MSDKILLLDDVTANQIAAGEVVERPASVVKELLENAIDAGGSEIKIEIEDGGKKLIRISDNGIGMSRNDTVMSLQRHATSKIKNSDDLLAINTLGFRGEAMPSISSVSRMEIITCNNENNEAVRLKIEGGVIDSLENYTRIKGTTINVYDLFYNTPARLKFLKTTNTELAHITDIVSQFAICYPHIRLELFNGGKQIILSSAGGKHINAITSVLGLDVAKNMVPFDASDDIVKVFGFVSKPEVTKASRKDQYLFVNGRPVRNRNILYATEIPFRNMLGQGKYPAVVLFVETDPNLIDVNVHPAKTEIKFANERQVHSLVYKAVSMCISKGAGIQSIYTEKKEETKEIREHKKLFDNNKYSQKNLETLYKNENVDTADFSNALKEISQQNLSENKINSSNVTVFDDPFLWENKGINQEESPVDELVIAKNTISLENLEVIAQFRNTYIVCQCSDGLLLIDQHVAHERVLYDKICKNKKNEESNHIQPLLIPEPLTFTASESTIISSRLNEIYMSGYDLESFGLNTFILRGHPIGMDVKLAKKLFTEMIDELSEISQNRHLIIKSEQVFITACCKMAIKAGQKLSTQEMKILINDLLLTENPFTCPHNRPVIMSISNWEIDRKFKRI